MTDAIVTFVVNALWQSSLAALCGIAIARLPRTGAATRYRLALAAFAAALLLPLASLAPSHHPAMASLSMRTAAMEPSTPVATAQVAITTLTSSRRTATLLALAWLAASLLAALRLAMRARRAAHLRRTSTFLETVDGIELRESTRMTTPMTMGRVILLPSFLRDPRLRAAAMSHELAHVRHRDYAVLVATELLAIPLAFHPLVHLLRHALDELREVRCDDAAAADARADYARALVALARLSTARDLALGMATTALERRVASLRNAPSPRGNATTLVAALAAAAIVAFAACHPVRPSIGDIDGKWTLDAAASDFGAMPAYTYFVQEIRHDGNRLEIRQHRRSVEGDRFCDWRVTTDGAERDVGGLRGARGQAQWNDATLVLNLRGPRAHREHATAQVIDGGRLLVCDVITSGNRYPGHARIVFRRMS